MASIEHYETKKGRRYRVRYVKPDRKHTDRRGFKTKREAQIFLNTVEVSKLEGTYIDPTQGKVTVGELAEPWRARQSHLKITTSTGLEQALRIHVLPVWQNVRVADVKRTAVADWVAAMSKTRSPTVVLRAHGALLGILGDAMRDRLIPVNPAADLDNLPKRRRTEHIYMTHEQVAKFAEGSNGRDCLVYTACYTGLRWGEMAGSTIARTDTGRRRLRIVENAVYVKGKHHVQTPKTHELREVEYPAFLDDLMADQVEGKGPDDLLFPAPRGGFLRHARSGERWFKRGKESAGVPASITPHDFRHTAASLAVQSGANVKAIQRMLGHASAAMTLDTYADLWDEDLTVVAEALNRAREMKLGQKQCRGIRKAPRSAISRGSRGNFIGVSNGT